MVNTTIGSKGCFRCTATACIRLFVLTFVVLEVLKETNFITQQGMPSSVIQQKQDKNSAIQNFTSYTSPDDSVHNNFPLDLSYGSTKNELIKSDSNHYGDDSKSNSGSSSGVIKNSAIQNFTSYTSPDDSVHNNFPLDLSYGSTKNELIKSDSNHYGDDSKSNSGSSSGVIKNSAIQNFTSYTSPDDSVHNNFPLDLSYGSTKNELIKSDSNHYGDDSKSNSGSSSGVMKKKWLLYFSLWGWSNQMKCLENAYYIARKLPHRGIILPPVVPHHGEGAVYAFWGFNMDQQTFATERAIQRSYLKAEYIPINHVLDVNFSLPELETIDLMDFFEEQQLNIKEKLKDNWVMETEYDHYRTRWIYQRSDLEGRPAGHGTLTGAQNGTFFNRTHRDIFTAVTSKYTNYQKGTHVPNDAMVITFLDAFYSDIDPVSMKEPVFQPRFSEPIRLASRAIRSSWGLKDYAAVHIRGSDGGFSDPWKIDESINTVIDQISIHIHDWLHGNSRILLDFSTKNSSNIINKTSSTSLAPPPPQSSTTSSTTVGLYIATDIKGILMKHKVFEEKTNRLIDTVKTSYNVTVELLWLPPFLDEDPLKKYVRYAEIFMDQQLASCATIAFIGTEGSTFSMFIDKLRLSKAGC